MPSGEAQGIVLLYTVGLSHEPWAQISKQTPQMKQYQPQAQLLCDDFEIVTVYNPNTISCHFLTTYIFNQFQCNCTSLACVFNIDLVHNSIIQPSAQWIYANSRKFWKQHITYSEIAQEQLFDRKARFRYEFLDMQWIAFTVTKRSQNGSSLMARNTRFVLHIGALVHCMYSLPHII